MRISAKPDGVSFAFGVAFGNSLSPPFLHRFYRIARIIDNFLRICNPKTAPSRKGAFVNLRESAARWLFYISRQAIMIEIIL
jgi:hypothetical protein